MLQRVIEEHPDDDFQGTFAHHDMAQSLAEEGELGGAATHYERAMEGPKDCITFARADLGLVEVIVKARWADRYAEASELLVACDASHDPFPATRFRWNLAAARLSALRGKPDDARELAALALRCLDEGESPFPRHRGLGLASADRRTRRELRRLAR